MKKLATICCSVLVALVTANAQAVSLGALFNGESMQVEDKLFSDWELILAVDSTYGTAIDVNQIEVTGLGGDIMNPGLHYEANGQLAVDVPSEEPLGDELLLWFGFAVTVTDPNYLVKDVSMDLGEVLMDSTGGLAWIEEFVFNDDFDMVADLNVFMDDVDQSGLGNIQLSDGADFGGTTTLWVETLIVVSGFGGDAVSLMSFDQHFSQMEAVPAPGTLALMALGLFSVALFSRRRRLATI